MKYINIFSISLSIIMIISGCATPTVKLNLKVPGELNLKGVSKIAIVDFNTIENEDLGMLKADKETLLLAKRMIGNVFYKVPFYSVTDLDLEDTISRHKNNAKLNQRFDAIVYGKLWWEKSEEYNNEYPKIYNLSSWNNVSYQSKPDKKGKTYTKYRRCTTQTEDKLKILKYRGQTYSLMMKISIYKVGPNGMLDKLTEIFEVAKREDIVDNGEYSNSNELVAKDKDKNKLSAMKSKTESKTVKKKRTGKPKEKSFFSDFTNQLNEVTAPLDNMVNSVTNLVKSDTKKNIKGDFQNTQNMLTISPELTGKNINLKEIVSDFNKKIAPHIENIEVPIDEADEKSLALMKNQAFYACIKYVTEHILGQGNSKASSYFKDNNLLGGAKYILTQDKDNKGINKEDLKELSEEYLNDNINNIFNLALSKEAIGQYEDALSIYRIIFDLDSEESKYADGIGRTLFALDMADKVKEEKRTLKKSKKSKMLK